MNKNTLLILGVVLVLAGIIGYYFGYDIGWEGALKENVSSFEECAGAGYPVMESYPRQCRSKNGKLFVEEIGNELEKSDLIRVNSPRPNEKVSSPLKITGEAKGFWFFEASFPVHIEDEAGKILAQHYIMTASEWMTEDFVPFEGEIIFSEPVDGNGWLVLSKDNPSGLPEHNDELRIPVRF